MLLKQCARCKKLIPYGKTYCDECQRTVDSQPKRGRARPKGRDTRFYSSKEWKTLSAKKLQDTRYKCERCGKIATEVHHIKPIQTKEGWGRRLDYDNCMSVCVRCHNHYHGRFKQKKKPNINDLYLKK